MVDARGELDRRRGKRVESRYRHSYLQVVNRPVA